MLVLCNFFFWSNPIKRTPLGDAALSRRMSKEWLSNWQSPNFGRVVHAMLLHFQERVATGIGRMHFANHSYCMRGYRVQCYHCPL